MDVGLAVAVALAISFAVTICTSPPMSITSSPIADGGTDELSNLRPACARCNRGWR